MGFLSGLRTLMASQSRQPSSGCSTAIRYQDFINSRQKAHSHSNLIVKFMNTELMESAVVRPPIIIQPKIDHPSLSPSRRLLQRLAPGAKDYDISNSLIRSLPGQREKQLNQNLDVLALIQAAQIQRLNECLDSCRASLQVLQRQTAPHRYQIQVKQLADKLVLASSQLTSLDQQNKSIKQLFQSVREIAGSRVRESDKLQQIKKCLQVDFTVSVVSPECSVQDRDHQLRRLSDQVKDLTAKLNQKSVHSIKPIVFNDGQSGLKEQNNRLLNQLFAVRQSCAFQINSLKARNNQLASMIKSQNQNTNQNPVHTNLKYDQLLAKTESLSFSVAKFTQENSRLKIADFQRLEQLKKKDMEINGLHQALMSQKNQNFKFRVQQLERQIVIQRQNFNRSQFQLVQRHQFQIRQARAQATPHQQLRNQLKQKQNNLRNAQQHIKHLNEQLQFAKIEISKLSQLQKFGEKLSVMQSEFSKKQVLWQKQEGQLINSLNKLIEQNKQLVHKYNYVVSYTNSINQAHHQVIKDFEQAGSIAFSIPSEQTLREQLVAKEKQFKTTLGKINETLRQSEQEKVRLRAQHSRRESQLLNKIGSLQAQLRNSSQLYGQIQFLSKNIQSVQRSQKRALQRVSLLENEIKAKNSQLARSNQFARSSLGQEVEKKVKQSQERLKENEDQARRLREEAGKKQVELEQLRQVAQRTNEQSRSKIQNLNIRLSKQIQNKQKLIADFRLKESQVQELRAKSLKSEQELIQRAKDFEQQLMARSDQLKAIKNSLKQAQQMLRQQQEQSSSRLRKRQKDLQSQYQLIIQDQRKLYEEKDRFNKKQISRLLLQLQKLSSDNVDLIKSQHQQQPTALERQNASLKESLALFQKNIQDYEREVGVAFGQLKDQNSLIKNRNLELVATINQLTQRLNRQESVHQISTQLTLCKTNLAAAATKQAELRAILLAREDQNRYLKTQISSLSSQVSAKESSLSQLRFQMDRIANSESKGSSLLQEQLAQSQSQRRRLLGQIKELTKEIQRLDYLAQQSQSERTKFLQTQRNNQYSLVQLLQRRVAKLELGLSRDSSPRKDETRLNEQVERELIDLRLRSVQNSTLQKRQRELLGMVVLLSAEIQVLRQSARQAEIK